MIILSVGLIKWSVTFTFTPVYIQHIYHSANTGFMNFNIFRHQSQITHFICCCTPKYSKWSVCPTLKMVVPTLLTDQFLQQMGKHQSHKAKIPAWLCAMSAYKSLDNITLTHCLLYCHLSPTDPPIRWTKANLAWPSQHYCNNNWILKMQQLYISI